MAFGTSPVGGLLRGLMAGDQARLSREDRKRQDRLDEMRAESSKLASILARDKAKTASDTERRGLVTAMENEYADLVSGLEGITPENAKYWRAKASAWDKNYEDVRGTSALGLLDESLGTGPSWERKGSSVVKDTRRAAGSLSGMLSSREASGAAPAPQDTAKAVTMMRGGVAPGYQSSLAQTLHQNKELQAVAGQGAAVTAIADQNFAGPARYDVAQLAVGSGFFNDTQNLGENMLLVGGLLDSKYPNISPDMRQSIMDETYKMLGDKREQQAATLGRTEAYNEDVRIDSKYMDGWLWKVFGGDLDGFGEQIGTIMEGSEAMYLGMQQDQANMTRTRMDVGLIKLQLIQKWVDPTTKTFVTGEGLPPPYMLDLAEMPPEFSNYLSSSDLVKDTGHRLDWEWEPVYVPETNKVFIANERTGALLDVSEDANKWIRNAGKLLVPGGQAAPPHDESLRAAEEGNAGPGPVEYGKSQAQLDFEASQLGQVPGSLKQLFEMSRERSPLSDEHLEKVGGDAASLKKWLGGYTRRPVRNR